MWTVEKLLFDIQKLSSSLTIYFYPSLTLISQSFHSYSRETSIVDYSPLFICSDNKIYKGQKNINELEEDISLEELKEQLVDYPVTTSIDDIEKYLTSDIKHKVVFSTYLSSNVLAHALRNLNINANIAVYDEAHNIALYANDKVGSNFLTLHDKENPTINGEYLPVYKRLFMTATPKHFQIKENSEVFSINDTEIAYSMDNESFFGKVAHHLSTKAAIDKGLIADYKIVAIYIDKDHVSNYIRTNNLIKDSDEELWKQAQEAVKIIATLKAIVKYGINKTIIFNGTIKKSKQITQDIKNNHKEFYIRHIDGSMSHEEKQTIMEELNNYKKIIISNAKILSEGVDVPSIDMVAFLNTTKSLREIVQRLGRTQRFEKDDLGEIINPDKIGYIFVPIVASMIEPETQGQFNLNKDVRNFYDIVNSLREIDEQTNHLEDVKINERILFESLRDIEEELGDITEETEAKKSRYKYLKDQYINYINASIVGENFENEKSWNENFALFKKFFTETNKYPDRRSINKEERKLGNWLDNQKYNYNKGTLSAKKVQLLQKIDAHIFENSNERLWNETYDILLEYLELHNKIPNKGLVFKNKNLKRWLKTQKECYYKGELDAEKTAKLLRIDPDIFDRTLEKQWNTNYALLAGFYKEYDRFPKKEEKYGNVNLGTWYFQQKINFKKNNLSQERIEKLLKIDKYIFMDKMEIQWEETYKVFLEYYKTYKKIPIVREMYKGVNIGDWYYSQKKAKNKLSPKRYNMLIAIDKNIFNSGNSNVWSKTFDALKEFYKIYNTLPRGTKEYKGIKIASWLKTQKAMYRKGALDSERAKKLLSIDENIFASEKELIAIKWDKNIKLLEEYAKNSNKYPASNEVYKGVRLGTWLKNQKVYFYKNELPKDRIDKIKKIYPDFF